MECSLQYVRRRQINIKDMSVESVKETQTDIENILTVKRNPVYYKHVTFEQDVVKTS